MGSKKIEPTSLKASMQPEDLRPELHLGVQPDTQSY
mgnify:CR=1 FL=1